MSYCRLSKTSEVYMYKDVHGGIRCCFCPLEGTVYLATPEEALVHLAEHRRAGHEVPQHAVDQLFDEIWEEELE